MNTNLNENDLRKVRSLAALIYVDEPDITVAKEGSGVVYTIKAIGKDHKQTLSRLFNVANVIGATAGRIIVQYSGLKVVIDIQSSIDV